MTELLLGCGASRIRKIDWELKGRWSDLITLDVTGLHRPDVVHDIANLPLPFEDDKFDEIHAYEVMEHVGRQGDWKFFFAQWSDIWRILKPGGVFIGTSPLFDSPWAWGDPGHTRIISAESITFLRQPSYDEQVGKSPMTDYRFCYRADFDVEHLWKNDGDQIEYVLRAVKPSRVSV